jgi:membrane-bound metal-dependent hydrolase YbcI (DUF457 family)
VTDTPLDNVTHTLFGATIARAGLNRLGRGATATILIASNIPDIDVVAVTRQGGVSYLQWHRGPTHGPLGVLGLGLATAAVVWLVRAWHDRVREPLSTERNATFTELALVAMLAVLLHLLMDFPTSYGTRLLSPFDWHWYAVDLMPIVDVYLLVVLATTLLIGMKTPEARRRNALLALAFMAGNYGIRAVLHERALALAPELFGPRLPPICDARAADPGPIDMWPRAWTVVPRPGAAGRCLVEIAATPDFISPFRWRLIARFSNAYSVQDLDLLAPPVPETAWRTARRLPDRWTPAAMTAAAADVAQIFLGFSRFPAVRTIPAPDQTTRVRWVDLRFGDGIPRRNQDPRAAGLFSATVTLDAQGRILDQRLGSANDATRQSSSLFPEYLGLEPPDAGAATPRIGGQTRLVAGLGEEDGSIPAVLDRHLRQQEPPAPSAFNNETVPTNGDLCWPVDALQRAEHRDLDPEVGKLIDRDNREARVRAASRDGGPHHDMGQRVFGFDVADATAKLGAPADRHEGASWPGEVAVERHVRPASVAEVSPDRDPGKIEQTATGVDVHHAATSLRSSRAPNTPKAAAR